MSFFLSGVGTLFYQLQDFVGVYLHLNDDLGLGPPYQTNTFSFFERFGNNLWSTSLINQPTVKNGISGRFPMDVICMKRSAIAKQMRPGTSAIIIELLRLRQCSAIAVIRRMSIIPRLNIPTGGGIKKLP